MTKTWILIAHGSAGKLIEVNTSGSHVVTLKEFSHPQTAKKGIEINTDRPGRGQSSNSPSRHAMDFGEEITDHERRVFAKEIVDHITAAFGKNSFSRLILVASKDLLGQIRKSLPDTVAKVVSHELNKDMCSQGYKDNEVVDRIKNDLGLLHF